MSECDSDSERVHGGTSNGGHIHCAHVYLSRRRDAHTHTHMHSHLGPYIRVHKRVHCEMMRRLISESKSVDEDWLNIAELSKNILFQVTCCELYFDDEMTYLRTNILHFVNEYILHITYTK